jgi:hypothetical protein
MPPSASSTGGTPSIATELVPERGQGDLRRPQNRAEEGLVRGLMRERDDQRIVGEQHAIAPGDHVDEVAELGQPVLPAQLVHRGGEVTEPQGRCDGNHVLLDHRRTGQSIDNLDGLEVT